MRSKKGKPRPTLKGGDERTDNKKTRRDFLVEGGKCSAAVLAVIAGGKAVMSMAGCIAEDDPGGCTNSCTYAFDGECDDGGEGSVYSACDFGTDCSDCGPRGGGYSDYGNSYGDYSVSYSDYSDYSNRYYNYPDYDVSYFDYVDG